MSISIVLVNGDPFGNNFRVIDRNANDSEIFNDYIDAHEEVTIECRASDAGYGNITTYQDNNDGINRSLLRDGERVTL